MFSDVIKSALEREIVGQPRAVGSVVRGVTRLVSGLTPRERSWCGYLLMGPTGTGKSHLVQALARVLHGDASRLVVADCSELAHGDPWTTFVMQLAPVFRPSQDWPAQSRGELGAPPLSILQIDYLERAPREVSTALGAALESGRLLFPDGRRGSLSHCLVFVTSGLGSREILEETTHIGFTGGDEADEDGLDRISRFCHEQAEKNFGTDLVGRLDAVLVFRRLERAHLERILLRLGERLNLWSAPRGFRSELTADALRFLLDRGAQDPRCGARDLVRVHRRFVEFPLADLLVSGRIPRGGVVHVDRLHGEEHLHFSVTTDAERRAAGRSDVAVEWALRPGAEG